MRILTLTLILFFVSVTAQDPIYEWPQQYYPPAEAIPDEPEPECDHMSTTHERFAQMRLLPPAKITSFTGKEVDYVYDDRFGNYVGKLTVNAETVYAKDLWKNYKGKWYWLLYCLKCGHLYNIVELSPTQLKGMKP